MNWFKNLNATPRLMISFGVLLALTLGIQLSGHQQSEQGQRPLRVSLPRGYDRRNEHHRHQL